MDPKNIEMAYHLGWLIGHLECLTEEEKKWFDVRGVTLGILLDFKQAAELVAEAFYHHVYETHSK